VRTSARELPTLPDLGRAPVALGAACPSRVRHARRIRAAAAAISPDAAGKLFQALAQAAKLAENVGERFPEEARRIHYEEAPARSIRGRASAEETMALLEEGIMVMPALVPHEDEFH
jgi:hypothetical protein